jgi:hypothetical protein
MPSGNLMIGAGLHTTRQLHRLKQLDYRLWPTWEIQRCLALLISMLVAFEKGLTS